MLRLFSEREKRKEKKTLLGQLYDNCRTTGCLGIFQIPKPGYRGNVRKKEKSNLTSVMAH